MKKFLLISTLVAGLSVTQFCFAQQADPSAEAALTAAKDHDTTELHETGLSGTDGKYQGNHQAGFGVQGMEVSITNSATAANTYASGHTSLELGLAPGQSGLALDLEEKSGVNLWNRGDSSIIPLLGIEPLNFTAGTSLGFNPLITQHTDALGVPYTTQASSPHRIPGHEPYIEWSPMAAVGFQVLGDTCKAMFAIRGGASIGTLGDSGARGAYGAGVSAVCKHILSFSADIMRIPTKTIDVDMASLRAFVLVPGQRFGIGAVLDGRDSKNVNQASPVFSLPLPSSVTAEVVGKIVVGGEF